MPTIKFDDYLEQRIVDPNFKVSFDAENCKLATAAALMNAREAAGLTQRELAELASVPQSTIARIERGNNTSFEILSSIASALGKKL
ncbi:transcriptional regulator [Enterococcus sp. JM4C]|uniref:helix-turn-helix domain-containing protein n=1 Tax=Candidatus Enterococcus huntleyi TaxID=1857217 RepID=UPI00137B3307|nr:helix-turn-helix transcriptional regulator [Enterococcus sp. JM4C]KAF1296238.1 transcriptional regulator [Enterococcus sp. JM4C]